jgi:hypothetical protein
MLSLAEGPTSKEVLALFLELVLQMLAELILKVCLSFLASSLLVSF